MESKLLVGGKNIVDHTNEQQKALEQRRKEISDQKVRNVPKPGHTVCFVRNDMIGFRATH